MTVDLFAQAPLRPAHLAFLNGGGECGALIAARDWSTTSLGPIESWPQSLKTATAILLRSPVPIVMLWNEDGVMIYNDAYSVFAGQRHPDLLGSKVREGWPEVADFNDNVMKVGLAGGTLHYKDQELVLNRRGMMEPGWMDLDYSPVLGEDGQPAGVLAIVVETTERVLADRRAGSERDQQRRALQQMPGFAAVLEGPEHRFEYVNDAYVRLAGERDFIGRPVRDVLPEVEGQGFYELLDSVYASGEAHVARATTVTLRGEERFVDFIYHPLRSEDGAVTGIFVGGYDTTEQVRADAALREAAERVQLALDAGAIVGMWVWDVAADRLTADARFAHSFGVDPELCRQGLPLDIFLQAIHPEDRPRVTDVVAAAVSRGGPYMCHYRVRPAGSDAYRWVEANGRVELSPTGEAIRFPGVLIDIEDRRTVEAERDRALDLLQTFSEAVPGVVYAKDREGRLLIGNRGTTELIGLPPEQYIGRTDLEVLKDKVQAAAVMANDRRIMESGVVEQIEEEVALPDGSMAVWLSTKAPLRNKAGEVIGLIGSSVDITARRAAEDALEASRVELRRLNETLEQRIADAVAEREQAQEALRQSQKLESMGQLTGGVAHDFNNLLTPIVGSLDMLQRRGVGGEREQRMIDGALQSAERAKTLVQRLLAFARRQPLQPTAVNVPALVDGMAGLIASTSGPQVKVVVDAAPGLPAAVADPNQLELALLNLGVNARDAMEGGGTLRISVQHDAVTPGHRSALPMGDYILLSVADTGVGMDEATLARAVEPFFSTKGVGKGTGLGLSMVHGLASQLGGALAIRSRRGLGTNVELWLPVSDQPAAAAAPRASAPTVGGAGKVLLVDDEEMVRTSTADMLVELGYEVTEASSAEEALACVRDGLSPDLIVTDHLMPGMTGGELIRRLREDHPTLRALLVSGYAEVDQVAPDLPRLAKPFRQADLAASLAALGRG